LTEEFIVVVLVVPRSCAIRSSLVIVLSLLLGHLVAVIVVGCKDVNANIMSP
jgi:Cu/Ag efflux pump CusA